VIQHEIGIIFMLRQLLRAKVLWFFAAGLSERRNGWPADNCLKYSSLPGIPMFPGVLRSE
jgi:hypothetical protein